MEGEWGNVLKVTKLYTFCLQWQNKELRKQSWDILMNKSCIEFLHFIQINQTGSTGLDKRSHTKETQNNKNWNN